jgi:hypothetical protein
MTLGTGIFLSAIVLGLIALFIATKDRWNWKKIWLWPISAVFVIGAVAIIVISWDDIKGKMSFLAPPHIEIEFRGIKLGMLKEDFFFLRGKMEPTIKTTDDFGPIYELGDEAFLFDKTGTVAGIFYKGPSYGDKGIQGVRIGDEYTVVTDKFGEPPHTKVVSDGAVKFYRYPEYNLQFKLAKGVVTGYGVRDFAIINLQ